MKYLSISFILLVLSGLLLNAVTLFESEMAGMSPSTERLLTFLLLVLLPGTGSALGIMSLVRKEGRAWLAVILAALNALLALFHLMIVLFAG